MSTPTVAAERPVAAGLVNAPRWVGIRPALVVAVLYLLAVLPALWVYPCVSIDEVTLNEPAKELALFGRWRSEFFADVPGMGFSDAYFWQPPGLGLTTAAVYRLLGFGIWQTRLPGVLAAAGCLVAIGAIARRLGGRRAVWIAPLLLATYPQFFRTALNARMDTLCWFWLLAALWLLCRGLHTRGIITTRRWAAIGLLVVIAGVYHPLAAVWAIALNGVLLTLHSRPRQFAAFNLPCALPGALWLGYAASSFDTWHRQFFNHGASKLAVGSAWARLSAEIEHTFEVTQFEPVYPVTIVAAVAAVFLARRRLARPVLQVVVMVTTVTMLLITFGMTKVCGEYSAYYFIPLILIATAGLSALCDYGPMSRKITLAALGVTLAISVGRLVLPIAVAGTFQRSARDYATFTAELRPLLKPGDIVFGDPEAWYATIACGAKLRQVEGRPDATKYDVVLLRPGKSKIVGPDFVYVGTIGSRIPPFWNRTFSANNYVLAVWRSRLRHR